MSARGEPSDALRAALAAIAAEDAPELVEDARLRATLRARDLIEDALVQELLRAAALPDRLRAGPEAAPVASGPESAAPESWRPAPPAREPAPPAREASWPEPAGDHVFWAYCVLHADDARVVPRDLEGIEPGTAVDVVTEGELAALVSKVPLADYNDERLREHLEDLGWVERTARAHEGVLDRALSVATIVPLRLCTLYRDSDGVHRLLRKTGGAFVEGLAAVDGCVELGVKVFALAGQPAAAVASESPSAEPSGASEEGSGRSGARSGAAYLSRRQDERERAERAREAWAHCAEAVHEHLTTLSRAATTNPPQRPEAHGREGVMLLNGAYLVARDRVAEIGGAVADLREYWGPQGFEIELTGPWPAYNFVSGAAGIVP